MKLKIKKERVNAMDPIMANSVPETNGSSLSFMDELDKHEKFKKGMEDLQNTPEAKRRILEREKECGKNDCLKYIIGRVYADSLPTEDALAPEDLDQAVSKFAQQRLNSMGKTCDDNNDCLFYVKEALKKHNDSGLRGLYEAVNQLIDRMYFEKSVNLDKTTPEELGFIRTGEVENSLDNVIRENNLDSLAEVIKDNVKNSVTSEIDAAKREKEDRTALEDSLKNDDSVTTNTDIQAAVESANMFNSGKIYQPSLFEGIMIGKFNALENVQLSMFDESTLYTEGILDGLKNYFKAKKAANAKATLIATSNSFNKWLDKEYRTIYGYYKSNINVVNMQKLISLYKEALTHEDCVNPNAAIRVIDCAKSEQMYQKVIDRNKAALQNYKNPGDPCPNSYVGINIAMKDFPSEVEKAIAKLHKAFDHPDLKGFIDNYGKLAVDVAKGAGTTKEVESTFNKVSYMAYAELNIYYIFISFVNSFINYGKKVVAYTTKETLKESAYDESVREFTMYNVAKALHLESFDLHEVKDIANDYASGKL